MEAPRDPYRSVLRAGRVAGHPPRRASRRCSAGRTAWLSGPARLCPWF